MLSIPVCSKKSTMRSSYKPQYSVEDRETTSLMKEQTRVKTMGFPRKVEVKGFASPPKAATGSRRAGSASLVATGGSTGSLSGSPTRRGHHKSLKASEMVDTFSSNVPLKWASTAVGNPTSSYTASFGGNPGHAPQVCVLLAVVLATILKAALTPLQHAAGLCPAALWDAECCAQRDHRSWHTLQTMNCSLT